MNFEDLLSKLDYMKKEEIEMINKAYNWASRLHSNQKRQSGEDYIVHPLNVAYILADMKADSDTICAGLLHDTIEDTNLINEDIKENFNAEVAKLVDGVTKISKLNFSSKKEENAANTRKIITSIRDDVRIVIIKLADRLHNMRTLQYKTRFKQKENALETMEIFVPLAYYIGTYRIKLELEDLCLCYLEPDLYKKIDEERQKVENENKDYLEEMLYKIKSILDSHEIPNEIKIRTKNIYGIYKNKQQGLELSNIDDLLALKIAVDDIENCYRTLYFVHSIYKPRNQKLNDYICSPKTNLYQSLHTTVFGLKGRMVHTQIKTFDMDKIASFGLTAYWDINGEKARNKMQEDLRTKFQFFKSLSDIDEMFSDNHEFIKKVKKDVFSKKICVFTQSGDAIELPEGSTILDFAYIAHPDIASKMYDAFVNEKKASVDYVLHENDIVKICTSLCFPGPKEEWVDLAKTESVKRKIKEFKI